MATSRGAEDEVRLRDDLTPEHVQRLRAAVRLVVNYLLDSPLPHCQNEIQINVERTNATAVEAVQLRLEL